MSPLHLLDVFILEEKLFSQLSGELGVLGNVVVDQFLEQSLLHPGVSNEAVY